MGKCYAWDRRRLKLEAGIARSHKRSCYEEAKAMHEQWSQGIVRAPKVRNDRIGHKKGVLTCAAVCVILKRITLSERSQTAKVTHLRDAPRTGKSMEMDRALVVSGDRGRDERVAA